MAARQRSAITSQIVNADMNSRSDIVDAGVVIFIDLEVYAPLRTKLAIIVSNLVVY
jgi:hypothetical protein